jgi:hypothetical protein
MSRKSYRDRFLRRLFLSRPDSASLRRARQRSLLSVLPHQSCPETSPPPHPLSAEEVLPVSKADLRRANPALVAPRAEPQWVAVEVAVAAVLANAERNT